MIIDTHMHTNFSDGKNSVNEMAEEASKLSYDIIAFSDHVWKTTNWVSEYVDEIKRTQERIGRKIKLLTALEAKLINFNGEMDIKDDDLKKIDFLIGAVHSIPIDKSGKERVRVVEENCKLLEIKGEIKEPEEILKYWEKATFSILKNKSVSVLAHPLRIPKVLNQRISKTLKESIVEEAIRMNKIIEINTYCKADDEFLEIIERKKPMILVGSDSHSIDFLRSRFSINKKLCLRFQHQIKKALEKLGV